MDSESAVPLLTLAGGVKMPVLAFGTAASPQPPPEAIKEAVLTAIRIGYRHFDTAFLYNTERVLGAAIKEAVNLGLIQSRSEVFITSKLWCSDAHSDRVIPAIKKTLANLGTDYVDLYLIHWPVSATAGKYEYPIKKQDFLPFEYKLVWEAMEECQKLGLAKAIGVSNFSIKKLQQLLAFSAIPPAVNQVEVNPFWQQKKLIQFCKENAIVVVAYSCLGSFGTFWGNNRVIESNVLQEIADSRGISVAKVSLRWCYENGIGLVVKSFNPERMKSNKSIFDWELSNEEADKIKGLPQSRGCLGMDYLSDCGPYTTLEELWDGEL